MKCTTTLLLFFITTLGWCQSDTNFFDFKEGIYLDLYNYKQQQPLFIEDLSSLNFVNEQNLDLQQMILDQQKTLLLMMTKLDSLQAPMERIAQLEKEVDELKRMIALITQSQNLNDVVAADDLIYLPATTFDVPDDVKINFAKNDYSINSESLMMLNEVMDILIRNPKWKIIIHGFANDDVNTSINLELARNRSLEIQRMLLSAGIDPQQLVLHFPDLKDPQNAPKVVLSFVQL